MKWLAPMLLVVAVGCSKNLKPDENPPVFTEASDLREFVVGRWVEGLDTSTARRKEYSGLASGIVAHDPARGVLTFRADGTCTWTAGKTRAQGTWTAAGRTVTLSWALIDGKTREQILAEVGSYGVGPRGGSKAPMHVWQKKLLSDYCERTPLLHVHTDNVRLANLRSASEDGSTFLGTPVWIRLTDQS